MKFCDNCGNLLRVKTENDERFLYCRVCGAVTKLTEEITLAISTEIKDQKIIVVSEEENIFPVIDTLCPKCGELRKAYWTLQQTRGGDEPPTRFYECKTCEWRWREYS